MPGTLIGVDFTSAPSPRKPITVARASVLRGRLRLQRLDSCPNFAAFEAMLAEPGPWTGAFDFPFGLPRAFVDALGLGGNAAVVHAAVQARCATRMHFRALVDAWGAARSGPLPHRATDLALGEGLRSTSPLQTRYVPVGFMWFEGLSRLLAAGLHLPGLQGDDTRRQAPDDRTRVALEGYPGALAFDLIGRRSYKNSDAPDRLNARRDLVDALLQGPGGGRYAGAPRLTLSPALHASLLADASGDRLDAVLCLVQAAWAVQQPRHGLPAAVDPVEGWIAGAG